MVSNLLSFLILEGACENIGVLQTILFIKQLLKIVFILIPIGLIVMISVDFAKNVMASREDDMKKNLNLAIKRVMMAVALFLIPTLANFVVGLVDDVLDSNIISDFDKCWGVTSASIEEQKEKNIANCTGDNYYWDVSTTSCVRKYTPPNIKFPTDPEKPIVNGNSSSGTSIGGVQSEADAKALQKTIEEEWIHTQVHSDGSYQSGPFIKYWSSSYNSLTKFQCTWWVYGRASMYLEQYGTKYKKYPKANGRSGNGGEWYSLNKTYGWFEYGQTPRPNSIVSYSGGKYGHVAYVEGVTSDAIWISDAGSAKNWRGVHKIGLDGLEWKSYPLNGYIYLDSPK